MLASQINVVFTDIADGAFDFDQWFNPLEQFAYIVLKDNSLLYINKNDMWYFDTTDELLYVGSGLINTGTGFPEMPETGIVHQDNLDRITDIIDFENINHIILHHAGEYLGGRR